LAVSSSQLGGAQRESLPQTSLAQSAPSLHALPVGQPGHSPPPQSINTSLPFCTPSPQAVLAHSPALAQNAPAAQSALVLQVRPDGHGLQIEPPQSVSLSSWLSCPSLHAAAAQTPASQRRDTQSAAALQVEPAAQPVGQFPPQSTPASPPFLRESEQLAATHAPASQAPLWQSASTAQRAPTAHVRHPPPQSMSVSLLFFCLSLHVAAMQLPSGHSASSQRGTSADPMHAARRQARATQVRLGPQSTSTWQRLARFTSSSSAPG
jgi:hypothetical protein